MAIAVNNDLKRGDRCIVTRHNHQAHPTRGRAKVLAVAEGYAMVRYPRATPFVEPLDGLQKIVNK